MKIHNEYDYLVHLLDSALHGTTPEELPAGLSFEKVLEYGKTHEVANLAYLAVEKLKTPPDARFSELWRQEYLKAIKRDIAQRRAAEEIRTALHSHSICTLEVQGTVVKKYYPQSHLRMMSDIDFIVPKDSLYEAKSALAELGYTVEDQVGIELDAVKGNVYAEIHTDFFDGSSATSGSLTDAFSYATYGENCTAAVSDTIFYLFHLLHTIKHALQKGTGIRRIVDLYYLEPAMAERVDHAYIDDFLKKYGFYETKLRLLAVKDHWFNGREPNDDLESFEREIFDSGNHGQLDFSYQHKLERYKDKGSRFPKISYLVDYIFPKKEYVYYMYPYCKEHHYPTALCWVYRWVFHKKKFSAFKHDIFGIVKAKDRS